MTEEQKKKIMQQAIDTYGADAQMLMAIEEMSELTKAICKYSRASTANDECTAFNNLTEEIADVRIMLEQIEIIFGCSGAVKEWETMKLERLKSRMESPNDRK